MTTTFFNFKHFNFEDLELSFYVFHLGSLTYFRTFKYKIYVYVNLRLECFNFPFKIVSF